MGAEVHGKSLYFPLTFVGYPKHLPAAIMSKPGKDMFEWHSASCLGFQAGKILHTQNANGRVFIKRTVYHHVVRDGDTSEDEQQEKPLLSRGEGAVPGIVRRDNK